MIRKAKAVTTEKASVEAPKKRLQLAVVKDSPVAVVIDPAIPRAPSPDEIPPSLIGLIEDVQLERMEFHHFFRPSMLSGCDRQNIFHYIGSGGEPQKMSLQLGRILDLGTGIHEVVQGYLKDHSEWWFANESRVSHTVDGFNVWGSCDGVLIRRRDGYRFAIEIKSISSSQYEGLTKPKPQHVKQASIYAFFHGCKYVVFLYFCKDNSQMREFAVAINPAHISEIAERVRHLGSFLEAKALPKYSPKTCDKFFCRFVKKCSRLPNGIPDREA